MSFAVRDDAVVTEIEVRYAETDQQGVAYHGNYFVWMEIGRTRYLEALGFPYHRMEAEGALFSVTDARCRYAGATRYGERVEIEDRFPRPLLQDLIARGHKFQKIGRKGEVRYGYAAAITIDVANRRVEGGAEPRRSHAAVAFSGSASTTAQQ